MTDSKTTKTEKQTETKIPEELNEEDLTECRGGAVFAKLGDIKGEAADNER